MDTKLFIIFIISNILNVILQTVKSLATVKCGKGAAALINAVSYGFYTYVIVLTVCDLPLWLKVLVVGLCNLVGVFVVKWGEEKARKDKLWKVEATVNQPYAESLIDELKYVGLPFNYIEGVGKYVLFNIYCATQAESAKAKAILDTHKAKYFVSESKTL